MTIWARVDLILYASFLDTNDEQNDSASGGTGRGMDAKRPLRGEVMTRLGWLEGLENYCVVVPVINRSIKQRVI